MLSRIVEASAILRVCAAHIDWVEASLSLLAAGDEGILFPGKIGACFGAG
jgi:hypothetical protein